MRTRRRNHLPPASDNTDGRSPHTTAASNTFRRCSDWLGKHLLSDIIKHQFPFNYSNPSNREPMMRTGFFSVPSSPHLHSFGSSISWFWWGAFWHLDIHSEQTANYSIAGIIIINCEEEANLNTNSIISVDSGKLLWPLQGLCNSVSGGAASFGGKRR